MLEDDDVTKQAGIIPYLLSDRTPHDEKHLSIRTFSDAQKRRVYEKQQHKCPYCQKNGIDTEYAFEEMEGDHIIPSHGVRVDVLLKIICRCFARNVTMIKEIDKTAKFLAQKSETKCYML